ncbi:hypothetical protein BDY19DRAFT_969852 [Irpex rosettiformis]|uniref:Uncharacterized protein n=1 Tax=Irpex rosettiformis TaxID=378272 RepID=A0ACB8TRU8_9APHY|nr:hypothetical protein BDY19DRAFT_969852 [Irpex rosettiformis]
MAKGKSSASSATRKKHARKAAHTAGVDSAETQQQQQQQKKGAKGDKKHGKKGKDKEPRKKVYIPPSKPAPVRPDPLDTLGIAQIIPAELLVVLRKLAKKDGVTKRRALEDLQADWVERARNEEEGWRLDAIVDALPVWLHHLPFLLLHPSRRIRLLTTSLHSFILRLPSPAPERLLTFLTEYIIGTWLLSSYDVDRQVAGSARDAWGRFTSVSNPSEEGSTKKLKLDEDRLKQLWDFVQRTLLDPLGTYNYVNPPQPVVVPPPPSIPRKGPARTPHAQLGRGQNAHSRDAGKEEDTGRVKSDEDEESEEDRKARMRVAAFGAGEWVFDAYLRLLHSPLSDDTEKTKLTSFVKPLENPLLWSSLYHAQNAPFILSDGDEKVQAIGWDQPAVRRAAWSFLYSIISNSSTPIEILLPTLSQAVLRSAWVEPDTGVRGAMWGAMLGLLKAHPEAWTLASTSPSHIDAGQNEDDDEDEDDSDHETESEDEKDPDHTHTKKQEHGHRTSTGTTTASPAYQEFLQFLELGCMGSPTQAYPAVLVVLSTIPWSILAATTNPVERLFTSFWAAVDGRALSGLDRSAAGKAFLWSVLECAVYISRRILFDGEGASLLWQDDSERGDGSESSVSDPERRKVAARRVISEQVKKAWEEISSGRLKLQEIAAAQALANTMKVVNGIDEGLGDSTWQTLSETIKSSLGTSQPVPTLLASTLEEFATSFEPGTKLFEANQKLTEEVVREILGQIETILQDDDREDEEKARLNSFVGVLDTLGGEVLKDSEIASKIDDTISTNAYRLLNFSPRLLGVYLTHRTNGSRRTALWRALLRSVDQRPDDLTTSLSALLDIVTDINDDALRALTPEADELDGAIQHLLLEGGSYALLKRLLQNPDPFISRQCFTGVLSTILHTFYSYVDDRLHSRGSLSSVDGLLGLLHAAVQRSVIDAVPQEEVTTVLRDVFVFAYIVPLLDGNDNNWRVLWEVGLSSAVSEEVKIGVVGLVKERLRDLIEDCTVPIRPSALVHLFEEGVPYLSEESLSEVVLAREKLDFMLESMSGQPTSATLAVIDPLVLPGEWDEVDLTHVIYDAVGLSSYARLVVTLLLHFLQHRELARQNLWALRHFLALRISAQDVLDVPQSASPIFSKAVSRTELLDLVQKVDQISAYLLSGDHEEGWLAQLASRLGQNKTNEQSPEIEILMKVLLASREGPNAHREARILRLVLHHLFANAGKMGAEGWLVLARGVERTAPHAAMAITYSVTQYAPEPPRLDRLRNELAANMFGIPPSKANTEGLWTLRRLAAVAPDPESDIVYLPMPRAVNLMKACQQWITSDEDLDEEVDSEMTEVFLHLAPILQNVPGSHWELIYDVVENNLENCSFDEESTLPLLSRTLKLIIAIEDLTSTNKSLRSGWDERRSAILTMVRDLIAKKPNNISMSTPLSVCRELALTIVQDLPQSLIGNDTLSKMCHLVTDASESVPQMAYKMLREAANKRTEYLVVETSVDTEDSISLDLPEELVQLLQNSFLDEEIDEREHNHHVFGYLLAWMLVFDLFANASLKVKSGYMDHLRRENMVAERFLPHIFTILRLYGGLSKVFKLDIWEVDEFYLEMYSADSPIGLPLLAAHLYYQALLLVPSLIRNWLSDCRDKQLSQAVTSYTSTHFSPSIVRAELAQVKDPSLAADLVDETFSVKVANAISEITAAFAVDEYSLELKLRLPSDFPLHTIIMKDSHRIGVAEDRWRSWILGVQQILTFRSGSIVDGLAFFKKNVTSHFEGRSECAICYSMISAMDSSLPKKPCKTCKNRFHAGCLYKWFNTSHSSSCPLCRSEIIQ